ncbi:NAD-dependent epimerase/dehydratase family protein [Candidatus Peregrinibacteria bacterium]|nr:NAD-dependent epimerase/dehydratase family protein [Candidatus Peregrinibacteria bacterium]
MTFWKDKKVLVTGATGFIGDHLVTKLLNSGAEVTEFIHIKESKRPNTWKLFGDLLDLESFSDALEDLKPDIVFHLAAQPIVGIAGEMEYETLDVNIRGTYNLLSVLNKIGVGGYVHISTDKVYGDTPFIEDTSDLLGLDHPYNVSKLCGDNLATMYARFFNVPTTIIRNANVYGEGDPHLERIVPRTVKRLVDGKNPVIRGDGTNLRDYVYVKDIVDGYALAAEYGYEKDYNVFNFGAECATSVGDIVKMIISLVRNDLFINFEHQLRGEIPNQHVNCDRVKEVLGWTPSTSLQEGLEKTVKWYQNEFKN